MRKWLSISEFAEAMGFQRDHIYRSVRNGRFPKDALRKNRKKRGRIEIHVDRGKLAMDENFSHVNRKRKPDTPEDIPDVSDIDEGQSIAEAQRLKELYNAKLKKLDYEQRRAALIERAEVVKDATLVGILVKEKLLAVPGRLGAMLAAESDPFKAEQMLKIEINQLLEDLSTALGGV